MNKKNYQIIKIKSQILNLIKKESPNKLTVKKIVETLGVKGKQNRRYITLSLRELTSAMKISHHSNEYQFLDAKKNTLIGKVDLKQGGNAYVIPEDNTDDVFIAKESLGKAFDGDRVRVILTNVNAKSNQKRKGIISEVIERESNTFIGKIQIFKNYAFFIGDKNKLPVDVYIPIEKINEANQNHVVVIKITSWAENNKKPYGEVIKIIGIQGEIKTESDAILHNFGIKNEFSKKVDFELKQISTEISNEEIKKRIDFRNVLTFTIDPVDAKDFDDALSIQKLSNGNTQVGVHIADVSNYVMPSTYLDKEAQQRATSVYLVDKVVPMLPELISNQICSLRPNEDKLTYSIIFEINEKHEIVDYKISKTLICSNKRFTYEEVQIILENKEGLYFEELNQLHKIAKKLRNNRIEKGSIIFDKIEIKFVLNEKKLPTEVIFKVQKDAHKLVEEYMLIANQFVSIHIGKSEKNKNIKPFIYRIHDKPNFDKIIEFYNFIKKHGYELQSLKENDIQKSMNKLFQEIRGKKEEQLIENLAIRSMAKAVYSTKNIGHYGLAFSYYTHFTSPIRRYPDLLVHRLIEKYNHGKKYKTEDELEELCKHASDMERMASGAERESTKLYQVIFMKNKINEEYSATITGVTSWGIYAEINKNKCEGMIRLRDIQGDYYYFDEANQRIVGNNNKKEFKIGDALKIRVVDADVSNRKLVYSLI